MSKTLNIWKGYWVVAGCSALVSIPVALISYFYQIPVETPYLYWPAVALAVLVAWRINKRLGLY